MLVLSRVGQGPALVKAAYNIACPQLNGNTLITQARNQDFMWGGANEAKVDQTTEMYFLLSHPFI